MDNRKNQKPSNSKKSVVRGTKPTTPTNKSTSTSTRAKTSSAKKGSYKKVVRASQMPKVHKSHVAVRATSATIRGIVKSVFTIFMVIVMIVCVVGTAGIIVLMQYIDTLTPLDITDIELGYTTTLYGKNSAGEDVEMLKISGDGYREWSDLEAMPQILIDAFVYTEDEEYLEHTGVDWLRTIAAFISMVGPEISVGGGSTITQQLIKNINGDFYNRTPTVKMQEILGAINLEMHYTKEQILEAYLNYVTLGPNVYGVKAAAHYYFGITDLNQLTVAQAASLACIAQAPNSLNPRDGAEENAERRQYTLGKMLEFGAINETQYTEALVADIATLPSAPSNAVGQASEGIYSWFVDAALMQVSEHFAEEYGYTESEALEEIRGGGYDIYTTVDIDMQKRLEEMFKSDELLRTVGMDPQPEAAMVIMDLQGNIQALVGGRDEKTSSLSFNRATQDARSAGSTMKPITVYGLGIQSNLINWSTIYIDGPKKIINGRNWPSNSGGGWSNQPITVADALKVSKNTVPVEIMQQLGIENCFNFLTDTLGFTSLDPNSIDMSENLTLGMTSEGVYLDELAASYNIFANGGLYYEPMTYNRVLNAKNEIVLQNALDPIQALDSDSSYIMNKMLWNVVNAAGGTGGRARISGMNTIGKTGTSDEDKEKSFVGSTPYYTAAIRTAYDQKTEYADLNVARVGNNIYNTWNEIMTEFHAGLPNTDFPISSEGVVSRTYCTSSGLLAGSSCTSTATGLYKENALPGVCSLSHVAPTTEETE